MRIWRGKELPGGPCSEGMIGTAKPEVNATLKFAGDALASTNRFDGSTAAEGTGIDCEWLKQCVHASTGRSKATSLFDNSEESSIREASAVASASALRSEPASASIGASSIVIGGMS